jgi:multiple sugar transport system permease protein
MRQPARIVAVNGALAVIAVLTLMPLAWMVSASLMAPGEASRFPPPLLPQTPTLSNYRELFATVGIGRQFVNSLVMAAGATALSLTFNVAAGYAFAKLRFVGRERLFRTLLGALVIPAQVTMMPLFLMLERMGLVNTLPGVLITLALLSFLGAWNDFMWPLIVLSERDLQTLPVALAALSREHVSDTELMMAGAVVTVLPVLLLFLALQRYYMQGLLMGSVKG